MSDLLIKNVMLPDGGQGGVWVRDGRIAALGADAERAATPDAPALDGAGAVVLPGAIDMHVHFRTPGGEHKETLLTGARAAAKGGVTTCADMPNTNPRTTTMQALREKMALAEGAASNLLYNFGAEPGNLEEVRQAAADDRVRALKIYMGPSTGQGGLAPDAVEAHFRQAAEIGLPVMVHAEDLERINHNDALHPHDAHHHHMLRDKEGELQAIGQAIGWAKKYGVQLYLAHVTLPGAVPMAEESGIRDQIYIEVCPHHLVLAVEEIAAPLENRYKVNPPLRERAERDALFAMLCEGRLDGIGSDHAPHTLAEKDAPYDSAPSGIPGVEYLFPMAITWWLQGRFDQTRLVDVTSANASRYFKLNKGAVAVGRDADLVLVQPDARWEIGRGDDRVWSKCGWTLYEGMPMQGAITHTLVMGRVAHP